MNYKFFLRVLGISTIKNIVHIAYVALGLLFLAETVPEPLYIGIGYIVFFALTFFFTEWMFKDQSLNWFRVIVAICITYPWDTLLSVLFFSWLLEFNVFLLQNTLLHVIFFVMHAVAMYGAYYIRRRFHAKSVLAEGLEA